MRKIFKRTTAILISIMMILALVPGMIGFAANYPGETVFISSTPRIQQGSNTYHSRHSGGRIPHRHSGTLLVSQAQK